jgi:hypothetical protein
MRGRYIAQLCSEQTAMVAHAGEGGGDQLVLQHHGHDEVHIAPVSASIFFYSRSHLCVFATSGQKVGRK